MPVKRCAVCQKPSYSTAGIIRKNSKWICSDCRNRFEESVKIRQQDEQGGKICEKCKKRSKDCPFSVFERQRVIACSDWEGKNSNHDKKRWAKYEQD